MPRNIQIQGELMVPQQHAGQQRVWTEMFEHHKNNNNLGFYTCIGHRGWWKSSFPMRLVQFAIENKLNIGWAAPVKAPIVNAWDDMFLKMFGRTNLENLLNKTEGILRVPDRMQVNFYSLYESTNVAGPTFPIFIVDEVGDINDGVITSVIQPIVMKAYMAYGWAMMLLIGTPNRNGRPYNDAYRYLELGKNGKSPNWKSFYAPIPGVPNESMTDLLPAPNPYHHPDYDYETMRRLFIDAPDKLRWLIEYCCMFLSEEGRQFQDWHGALMDDFDTHIEDNMVLYRKSGYNPEGQQHQAGVDVGRVNDYTIISIINVETKEMVYFQRYLPKTWGNLYKPLKNAMTAYEGTWLVDSTGGGSHIPEYFAQTYGLQIEGVNFSQTNKPLLLDNLASALERPSIRIFNLPIITNELEGMMKTARRTGGYTIEAVKGEHDDIPMAMALMIKDLSLYNTIEAHTEKDMQREIESLQATQYSNLFQTLNPYATNHWNNI